MIEHLTWVQRHPTPQGNQGRVMCLCGFESSAMSVRWCDFFAYVHESGIPAMPGVRLNV